MPKRCEGSTPFVRTKINMATIKELGVNIGDTVEYHTSIPNANYGPSYSPETYKAQLVGITPNFGERNIYEVYLFPPHLNDLPCWAVQDTESGEFENLGKDIKFNFNTKKYEITRTLAEGERFVSYHRGNDPHRFVGQTLFQRIKDFLR